MVSELGSALRLLRVSRCSSRAVTESVDLSQGLVSNRFGNRDEERSHGGDEKGSILSCSWLVWVVSLESVVLGFLRVCVGKGGGKDGAWIFLHALGKRWMMALELGSLLIRIAYLRLCSWAWSWRGGMDASSSSALVGVVLKAAQTRHRAFLWTFSRARAWHFVLFHHEGQA